MTQITIDLDELFDKLNYSEQLGFLKKKLKEQTRRDTISIIENVLTLQDLITIIESHIDVAIDVVKKYEIIV